MLILEDANNIQQVFSAKKEPTLWHALPTFEHLLSAWEKKKDDPHYTIYVNALEAGLKKIMKYYLLLDQKPAFVLALLLHPYFKLNYIKMAWGGEEEQKAKRLKGNPHVKNWQDEAMKIVKQTMQQYWATCPCAGPVVALTVNSTTITIDKFDLHCQTLITCDDNEGWQAEL
ncbi:hypothetical protein H0H87_007006 [Tephrocybe sp. NHM501043]|nr:hypothetical protein H0H87_007006 [Tephrocybe sp. NHM501043]